MKHIRFFILTISLFIVALATAQTRGVANNAIPGDNNLRYYRFAIAIAQNSYTTDFGSNYDNVKNFWQECEDFMNEVYVPLGMCFDVVIDQRLLLSTDLPINNDGLPNVTGVTDLINNAIGSDSYDVGLCISYRDKEEENTGLSALNGAYSYTTKANGYAQADKWVVAHEAGHLFGADHTTGGEGSLMDNIGEFFSYPSIKKIRGASVSNGPGNAYKSEVVANKAPAFTAQMKDTYRIPKGACLSIPVYASDADGHSLRYVAIGCSSSTVGNITEGGTMPHFASLKPQASNIIDYRPEYTADGDSYYLPVDGTNIPSMSVGLYSIAILVNDMPEGNGYDYLNSNPFYSNYAVWDATVEIVDGNPFTASISPAQESYTAGSNVTVTWGVNNNVFTEASRVRITMSTDYGKTFNHVLADDVRALDGSKAVTLPNVNVGNVDVDFSSKYVNAVRSMRAGIIRVEIIDGAAYTLTTLSPENGGGFNVTGGSDAPDPVVPTTYTVSVQANPATSGTATVNGNSTATVDSGSTVTLIATANSGYKFDGWYLNSTLVNTNSPYSLSVTGNATYVAEFSAVATPEPEPGQQAQDMLVDGAVYQILNLNYTNPQKYILDNNYASAQANTMGTDVQNSLWIATKKSGNCYSLKNSKTNKYLKGTTQQSGAWQMSTDESFVYIYKYSDGQYYISAIELSDITKQSMSCAHNPGDHYNLVTWNNVDDKGELVVPSMWNFVEYVTTYTVNVSAENGGTASSTATTVKHGDKVTLTATAPDGYTFDGWYDSDEKLVDESKSNPYTFEVTGNIDYTAKFTQIPAGNTYTITVTSNKEGGLAFINERDVKEGVYSEGAKIKLCAVEDFENSGYIFTGWYKEGSETPVSTEKNWEFVVTESVTYEARFEKGCIVQALDRTYMCQVTICDTKGNFGAGRLVVRNGEKVTLSAYVDPYYKGYTFLGWCDTNGEVLSNDINYEVTVTEDVIYYAVAELAHYTLTVSTPDESMGSVRAASGTVEPGTSIEVGYNIPATISAIPANNNILFVKWTTKDGTLVAETAEYDVPAINDLNAMVDVVEYVAHFKERTGVYYNVQANVEPLDAGYVEFSAKEVEEGGSITLTAVAYSGYKFVRWTLDGEEVGTEEVLTVNNVKENLIYHAYFESVDTDPLAGRWFRLKEMSSGKYMNISDNDQHSEGAKGGVNVTDFDRSRNDQIFNFIKSGTGYKLLSKTGYYIYCQTWNVDAYSKEDGTILTFNPTGNEHEYRISSSKGWFKVGTANGDNSGISYVYCDAPESARATWVLEEVADKSKLQELIAEATELFNRVADDKTKINIAGKITSNAGHNVEDGNTGITTNDNDGAGIAGLTDDDPSTYFHSRWKGTDVYEPHYLQINLGEDESLSNFCFEYATRKAGSAGNTSPAPTAMEVRVSTDGQNFGDPIAQYAGGTNANSLPAYDDLGKTLWNSGVISAGEKIRHIRLTVTNSAGPGNNTFNSQYFFAMGTLNLYSTQPSLKEEYKDYPAITEELLLALSASLANANDVNNNDAATTELVNEAIQTLRAQKEALESALVPASFTLSQVTAGNLMERTEPTYIAVKNISGTNNYWFAGTSNVDEFLNSNVLVWEPVVEGKSGSYYIRNTYGKYIQNTTPISFGTVTNAAVFTAVNATSKGSGETKFNGDNNNENTLANINTADDPNLVRFVTGTQWINVQTADGNPTYNDGEGGYTVHFVYEATMVNEFTVNVTDAQFATFYAPVKVELPDNAKAYIINKIESHDWVSLAEVEGNVLPEKTAVILHSETPGDCKLAVTNETADAVVDGNKLLGTVNDAYIVKNSEKLYYILAKRNDAVGMYVPVLGENVNKFKNRANKAYLVLDEIEVPQMSAGFRFILPGATAVEEVTTDNAAVETIYDLQGRKLTEIASPGIYIINGKKVFVK